MYYTDRNNSSLEEWIHWDRSCSLNLEEILSLTAVVPEFPSRIFAVSLLALLSSVYVLGLMWFEFNCLKFTQIK